MISFKSVDWAINEAKEILVALETLDKTESPETLVIIGKAGFLLFGSSAIIKIDIPEEILVSVCAAADILILSLRGGEILAEKRVTISRV
jgi:prefoldin subunit 5